MGCPFHPRCPLTRQTAAEAADDETVNILSAGQAVRVLRKCVAEQPQLVQIKGAAGHEAACWVNT
jgi:hypothetical protein